MKSIFLLSFCIIICSTSAELVPIFSRLSTGKIQVIVPDFPGLTAVTLTLEGSEAEPNVLLLHLTHYAAEGRWKTTVPDVTNDDDRSVNYIITYTIKDQQHQIEGSADLDDGKKTSMARPITPRYLQRRTTIVLHDDFTSGSIDPARWRHAVTGYGGGNNEFNMYTPEPVNSYVKHNMLYIRPTLTVDHFGEDFLTKGDLDVNAIWGECRSLGNRGCHLSGQGQIPPIMSAMLMSKASIRYGKVTVNAKLPKGDWLWPAFWLLSTENHYGGWPRSGEIDIMESRGNAHYHDPYHPNQSLGRDYNHAAIHFGSNWEKAHRTSRTGIYRITGTTFTDSFHSYWMDWTADYIKLGVDEHTLLAWNTPAHGYWPELHLQQGDNLWASGGRDAPFDRPFFLILNVAVGGGWFWEPTANAPYPQPWQSHATKAEQFQQFWNARHLWEPTWHGENVAMKIRSVTMEQY